jgi:hypothetical protein
MVGEDMVSEWRILEGFLRSPKGIGLVCVTKVSLFLGEILTGFLKGYIGLLIPLTIN